MKLERQILFWIGVLVALIGVIWLLHQILLPFVAGMALAYLLNPLANRIERLGVNRIVATLAIVGVFVLALVVVVILVAPVLAGQFVNFMDNLPDYSARLQALISDPGRPWLSKLVGAGFPDFKLSAFMKDAAGALATFLQSLWSSGQALFSLLSLLIVTPVVAIYLLQDWNRIVATVDRGLPRDHADTIRGLLREIDRTIAGFVRGQTGVCLILASCYVTGFMVIGLNFGFLIGFATGIASFIPYVGTAVGVLIALAVAVVQFWPDWMPILAVLGVSAVCQVIESYVLSPYLVGPSVGLHPVWLMFALFAFGSLFGFLGLLVAIPVAAAVGVLVRFALRQYLASRVYTGDGRR